MMEYKRKGNNELSIFISFLILIFSFLISSELIYTSGGLRTLNITLFFTLAIVGSFYSIKTLRNAFIFRNWKYFLTCIFLLSIYLIILIKVVYIIK